MAPSGDINKQIKQQVTKLAGYPLNQAYLLSLALAQNETDATLLPIGLRENESGSEVELKVRAKCLI